MRTLDVGDVVEVNERALLILIKVSGGKGY